MLNEFIITDFGAVGDGKTDCTEAVQKALDMAADCMGKVVVPPGTYMVGQLDVHGCGVTLEGTSAWSFRNYGASIFVLKDENAECMLEISGAFGCTIKGMSLNGNLLGKNIHGVKIYWDKYNGGGQEDTPLIDDCKIGHFSGDGVHLEHIWCFSMRHSMLYANEGAGLFIDGWDGFVMDNWFTGNKKGGVVGGDQAASLTFTGNRVEWNRIGGFVLPNTISVNITGNYFDRSFGPGLQLGCAEKKAYNVSATGNLFHRNGALDKDKKSFENIHKSCHVYIENGSGVTLNGNSMRMRDGDGGKGGFSPDFGIVIKNCTESVVTSNAMWQGACVENIVSEGDNSSCVIKDNPGSVFSRPEEE